MWPMILIVIAVLLIGFVILVMMQPSHFTVTRSAPMSAPPEEIFPHVNDLHKWEAWSPWAKMDPEAKNLYEGPEAGVGSSLAWDGKKTGAGKMTILESTPSERIKILLEFQRPFKATNDTVFTFQRVGSETLVTWTMSGESNFIGKAMGLFMSMDKMVGGQFEEGLSSIREIVENKN